MDRAAINYAHSDALQLSSEFGLPEAVLFLPLLLPAVRRGAGFGWRVWWSVLPTLLLAGLYDAHLTAIPGTFAGVLALAVTSPRAQPRAPAANTTVRA